MQVQAQMTLGRRLAPAVLGPVHAGGHQLDRRRIDHMDYSPETPGDSLATAATGKAGLQALEMTEHRPENLFGQAGIALLVAVRKIIATRRRRGTQRNQKTAVHAQRIADVVESNRMRELRIDQADQVTPRAELTR